MVANDHQPSAVVWAHDSFLFVLEINDFSSVFTDLAHNQHSVSMHQSSEFMISFSATEISCPCTLNAHTSERKIDHLMRFTTRYVYFIQQSFFYFSEEERPENDESDCMFSGITNNLRLTSSKTCCHTTRLRWFYQKHMTCTCCTVHILQFLDRMTFNNGMTSFTNITDGV